MKLIENSPDYYDGVKNGTLEIIKIVDNALKGKVKDRADREEVCEEIVTLLGGLLDSSGAAIDEDGKEHIMAVCFVSDDGDTFQYHDSEVGFHDMAIQLIEEFYDE
ncbi:MAG: hypothetical protein QM496_04785 [Verrucomicrobiota bacterium]